jgi:hypothetical protein
VDSYFKPLSVEDREKARVIELELAADTSPQPSPHGSPTRNAEREKNRFNFVEEDDFLMLNVNKNEFRKDPLRSLEILKGLRDLGVPAKLLLRMDAGSAMGGIHIDAAASQLGLTYGKEYCHIGAVPDNGMVALYNAADLYLTTSLGEGWGLGVTEAMACHCPVAMPRHTSLAEIGAAMRSAECGVRNENGSSPRPSPLPSPAPAGEGGGPIWLPTEEGHVGLGSMRLRKRVDLHGAVREIYHAYAHSGNLGRGARRMPAEGQLKSWDWVANRLWDLLTAAEPSAAAQTGGAQ